ncbi:MAG TPA: methyl-accepting chemotaxis protein [Azospira sp.]|nr:methyl-accepting chemotaxis protein [Azospira sp.]HNN08799.1 methyl-accepting chemotaxis protein [Azospira sp.]HNN45945.1 methyl-accepting chemotaxis protein [Azospira sp.]
MLGKLTVAKRLACGFGLFLAMLALAIYIGLTRLETLNAMTERIVSKDWQKTVLANDAIDLMNANARETFLLFHTQDRAAVLARIEKNKQLISDKLDALGKLIYRAEGKALLDDMRERRKAYVGAFSKVPGLLESGRESEASRIMGAEVVPALDALLASIDKLIQFQGKILDESAAEARALYEFSRTQMLIGMFVSLFIGFWLARWVVLSVVRPLGGEPDEVKEVAESIAGGDLTPELTVRAGDEHSLMAAMQKMQLSLRQMVGGLQNNAEQVASAAQQLATSSSQVAVATSAQSEASSSMAAAVEQMTVSVNHVSERANETHAITSSTGHLSRAGNQVIQETVSEMQEVARIVGEAAGTIQRMGESSQQISGIVQVIKDVADQTNLLALNAAIEAARAGEQGRGFAVVADEVRKLAERTTKATAEIASMIDAVQSSASEAVSTMELAVDRVSSGVDRAQRAGSSMTEISSGTESAVLMVNEISSALREQSVASNEIAVNVEKIAQMSEENGAATREVAETATLLERLAEDARTAVARFRLA